MTEKTEFYVERANFGYVFNLYGKQSCGTDNTLIATPLNYTERSPGDVYKPFASIDETAAQQLMDELWRCGLRPSQGQGSAGSLAATERHLEDMRTLVFKTDKGA